MQLPQVKLSPQQRKSAVKLLLLCLAIIVVGPSGIVFPKPLLAPRDKVVPYRVDATTIGRAMIFSLRRPRTVTPISRLNHANRAYLESFWKNPHNKRTSYEVENGLFPPLKAVVFVQAPPQVAPAGQQVENTVDNKGREHWIGSLSYSTLTMLGGLNDKRVDLWVITPSNETELSAFLHEYCAYRHTVLVVDGPGMTLTAAKAIALARNPAAKQDTSFAKFCDGVVLYNSQVKRGELGGFTNEEKERLERVRVLVLNAKGEEATQPQEVAQVFATGVDVHPTQFTGIGTDAFYNALATFVNA